MTRFLAKIILLFLLAGPPLACAADMAASRVQCGNLKSRFVHSSVGYCALLPPGYDADTKQIFPVLYLLHGLGDNHETLINTGIWNMVEELQGQRRIGRFVIVTPQAGRSFYVDARNGRMQYEQFFVREFVPAMEKRFRMGRSRARRAIGGISMGGFGALRFAFKFPQMFSSVSAHSAALIERMPKGAEQTPIGAIMGNSFGVPFDPAYWEKNTPFVFARSAGLRGLKIYFDCGSDDDYGFEAGAEALHRLLLSRKVAHEFHLYPGRHDWTYFSEHLPASLEFHSRNLAAAQ